ncbi:MAG TPA: glutaredoxin family protein [Candidatus Competibacter sp.]|nr:glutaredoxin family protein [Candidatus Competibacteraceae bacterium]HRC71082.1 glutaredoxin family protein [Candidatus Competibacter sp.]
MNLGACKIKIVLFSTVGCHLCERAEDLLRRQTDIALELVEIADDPVLLERYGVRIPVALRAGTGRELDWPFDAAALRRWLDG